MNFLFKSLLILLILWLAFFPINGLAQKEALKRKIEEIVLTAKGDVGVAMMGFENRDTLTFHGQGKYPMQSVYKFPLAMAVLDQVDKGKLSLDQKIHVEKTDLLPDTWSPLREKYPTGNVDVPLRELLSFTVSQSDNNGCDILFRLLGGTHSVQQYIHGLGVKGIAIAGTEEEMHKDWNVQFTNWCEPIAMLQLLDIFYKGKILSKSSNDFLWKIMTETSTGPNRIKGLLPVGTKVAHKTGSSGSTSEGLTAATNDVGIVALPDGKHFAIVVYVSNATADGKTLETVIAHISKAAWDYFSSTE